MTHAVQRVDGDDWAAVNETELGGGVVFLASWDVIEAALRNKTSQLVKDDEQIDKIRSTSEGLYIYVVPR